VAITPGAGGCVEAGGLACWKQDRQSTGLPCVGLKGTVVSVAHCEHTVRVSARTPCPGPAALFALHCLHRFGSFLNCLSWKKSCSPAVNMKSLPQSTHFNTLSTNSIFASPGPCLELQMRLQRHAALSFRRGQPGVVFFIARVLRGPAAK
jgi:hypothetical protein